MKWGRNDKKGRIRMEWERERDKDKWASKGQNKNDYIRLKSLKRNITPLLPPPLRSLRYWRDHHLLRFQQFKWLKHSRHFYNVEFVPDCRFLQSIYCFIFFSLRSNPSWVWSVSPIKTEWMCVYKIKPKLSI